MRFSWGTWVNAGLPRPASGNGGVIVGSKRRCCRPMMSVHGDVLCAAAPLAAPPLSISGLALASGSRPGPLALRRHRDAGRLVGSVLSGLAAGNGPWNVSGFAYGQDTRSVGPRLCGRPTGTLIARPSWSTRPTLLSLTVATGASSRPVCGRAWGPSAGHLGGFRLRWAHFMTLLVPPAALSR